MFNRTSLGVAGLEAASRFRITPGQLSVFVLAQLGVYAAMQVPTGLLVDRYGPRRLLITAACTMAVAQLAFAFVQSYPGALLARAILGCGDGGVGAAARRAARHGVAAGPPLVPVDPGARGVAHSGYPAGLLGALLLHVTDHDVLGPVGGAPYLVAQGFSPAAASAVLLVCVLAAIAISPAAGMVFGRFPAARVPFAVGVCLITVAGWVTLLACFDGRPPHALIIAVAALMAAGGPASTIGFSLARDYNGRTGVGTATGVVNVGGFSAAILVSLLVGGILDLAGRSDAAAYRLAFGCAVGVQLLGTVMAVRWWLRVRGLLLGAQSRGEPVPVRVVERPFDRAAGHNAVRVLPRDARRRQRGTQGGIDRQDPVGTVRREETSQRARRGHDDPQVNAVGAGQPAGVRDLAETGAASVPRPGPVHPGNLDQA